MSVKQLVLDAYSWFDHKKRFDSVIGVTHLVGSPFAVPGWVPPDEQRRLMAYQILESYYRNSAREWLDSAMPEDDREQRREYGDAHLLVEQALSSLLGKEQRVIVKKSKDEDVTQVKEAIDDWMLKEKFIQKLVEGERNATKLGDNVYVLGWDAKKKRPRLTVYDPGFYFPDLFDQHLAVDDYPDTVCIAYEFVGKNRAGEDVPKVRRIRWDLVESENERFSYPWNNGEKSNVFCQMSDGVWDLDEMGDSPWALNDSKAEWLVEPQNIGFDFIPVIHVPNTVPEGDHYGTSVLASVMQVLDDIVSVDTDLQAAAATTGSPPIALAGSYLSGDDQGRVAYYGPGQVLQTGDGTATLLDTSRSLDALLKLKDSMLERLSVNSRTPESLLGRVKPNEVPSGIALTLSFSPHSSFVNEMRLVRNEKYPLLFKFVQRMMLANKQIANVQDVELKFGSFLPADMQEVQSMVVNLLGSKAISRETGVTLLVNAGFPIEDVEAEVDRILTTDYEAIQALMDITGDINAARSRLGLAPIDKIEEEEEDDPFAMGEGDVP